MKNTVEIAPDYYLDNFCTLIQHANQWYRDLLTLEEHLWLSAFEQLHRPAQCALVRLYSRKGCWFRSDKLNYQEIPNMTQALAELASQGFIQLSPVMTQQELATNLLTKAEILSMYPKHSKSLKKDALIECLSQSDFDQFDALDFIVIKLNEAHMIDVLLTLFFANTRQDLSQFVLDDLG